MSRENILIVDNDQSLMNLLKLYLEADGYMVQILSSGKDAISEVKSDIPPDVVVLNSQLPEMSGHEVVHALRSDRKTWAIPIILFHEEAIVDRMTSLDSGADDYIRKPFSRGEFKARIAALLRRSAMRGDVEEF